ncbi:MAG: excinuclease ABC subunit UvrC [bacterium]|nr:excinuclease ABC subunit UvrC [bacterium]
MVRAFLDKIPDKSGVYLMKDREGKIIYVGKAKCLKNRVQSYFNVTADYKSNIIASKVRDIDYVITNSEIEALILEANLIKLHLPRYNIRLKDDKKYPYIKITVNEEFPRVFSTRDVRDRSAVYFGPYTDVKSMKRAIKYVRNIFPVRSCKGKFPTRSCLNYHLGKCSAPCDGKITKEEYMEFVNNIMDFLSGKSDELGQKLKSDIDRLSKELKFEEAAKTRDRLKNLQSITNKQRVVFEYNINMDVFGLESIEHYGCIVLIIIRNGKIVGTEHYMLHVPINTTQGEIVRAFILQYYKNAPFLPSKILTEEIEEKDNLEGWLKVEIMFPGTDELKDLIKFVKQNASFWLTMGRVEKMSGSLVELQKILKLRRLPVKIEAFDISNLGDKYAVGSSVAFQNGRKLVSGYRRYRIKTIQGVDDVGMMREIVSRRIKHGKLPDLILIDGGTGQTRAARECVPEDVPVFGLAKKFEQIHTPEGKIISLPKGAVSLRLLQQIRDEAHRFAITYHKKIRDRIVKK